MSETTTDTAVTGEVDSKFNFADEDLNFGSQDLQIDKLVGTIKRS